MIILSREGRVHGHFEIAGKSVPTDEDRLEYPPVKCVYTVTMAYLYEKPVNLSDFGIKGIQFCMPVSDEELEKMKMSAGKIREFTP